MYNVQLLVILEKWFNSIGSKELYNVSDTTYNVFLRYLAFISRCYSLLPIMLKIFDVICQLADDFYEKSIFFHISLILSGFKL